jgi:hypothetical protein
MMKAHLADFQEAHLERLGFPCMHHEVLPKLGTLTARMQVVE